MTRFLSAAIVSLWTSMTFAVAAPAATEGPDPAVSGSESSTEAPVPGIVARVGDQDISYRELSTMLNSSAVVGVSVPAIGSRERDGVMIVLLDKMISANLLYLDALKQGVDKDPGYQRDLSSFSADLLAFLYREKEVVDQLDVPEDEIRAAVKSRVAPGKEVSEEARPAIIAMLRKQKYDQRMAGLRDGLRQGIEVTIDKDALTPDYDELKTDTDVVARFGSEELTWGEVKAAALAAKERAQASGGKLDPVAERVETVNQIIDKRLMAQKAREAGLDRDPRYQSRYDEYKKSLLINRHRQRLLADMAPTDAEIDTYFEANRPQISAPERRKVQMVVLKTKAEAESIKQQIESGAETIYEAARDYSIDPNAKRTLGEMGWVAKGSGFPALDELTFALKPDEIGGPVESPAGWHLVKVLDEQPARNNDVAAENTRKLIRRKIMHERLDKYEVNLRLNDFKVVVYQDRLNDMFKKEAALVAKLEEKAKEPGSLTEKRKEELEELLKH